MTNPEGHADQLRARMVRQLAAELYLARWETAMAPWWPAFETVPRHRFMPDTIWVDHDGPGPTLRPLCRAEDPDRWLELAYADDAVVTQINDGCPGEPTGTMPTSSASAPLTVAVMLAALDAHPGQRVCEIGTGTGYNAALLAHRLGAAAVTTIEVDPEVADHARAALVDTGHAKVCVITADGALGHPSRGLYDRIIATAAAHRIPYAWVAQTRPGSRVLLPWANSYTGALVALTVDEQGTASGTIVGESSFMWLRGQRGEPRGPIRDVLGDDEGSATPSTTWLHPYWISADFGARFAIGQRVARCQWRYWPYDERDGIGVLWLLDFHSRSWAKLTHTSPDASDEEFRVHQYGSRRLWDEVAAAHQWWTAQGRPSTDRWRFIVTPHGQRIELSEHTR